MGSITVATRCFPANYTTFAMQVLDGGDRRNCFDHCIGKALIARCTRAKQSLLHFLWQLHAVLVGDGDCALHYSERCRRIVVVFGRTRTCMHFFAWKAGIRFSVLFE